MNWRGVINTTGTEFGPIREVDACIALYVVRTAMKQSMRGPRHLLAHPAQRGTEVLKHRACRPISPRHTIQGYTCDSAVEADTRTMLYCEAYIATATSSHDLILQHQISGRQYIPVRRKRRPHCHSHGGARPGIPGCPHSGRADPESRR